MIKFFIKKPIWENPRSVGIAEYKIIDDIEVEIGYKDKQGNRLYPWRLKMSKQKALTYPTRQFVQTPDLKIIPIKDFEII